MRKVLSIFGVLFALTLAILPMTNDVIFVCKETNENKVLLADEKRIDDDLKQTLGLTAKSLILIDAKSGKVIYGNNEYERLAPASMTKIVTLIVVMKQIESGALSLDGETTISEYAASQEGSECYLDARAKYKIKDLIKSVAVASANDSSVALAEATFGDEKVFVNEMNKIATELGMTNTNFVNCTGLDAENHYSCAYDMCLAIKELSKYNVVIDFSKVWCYDMEHSKGRVTNLTNTNRLIRSNPDLVLAKTGHTDNAGYCLTALAKRGDNEVIASVFGVSDSKVRFSEINKLLNYGLTNFDTQKIIDKSVSVGTIKVNGAEKDELEYYPKEDYFYLVKKGEKVAVNSTINLTAEKLKAPIVAGQVVGEMIVNINGEEKQILLEVRESVSKNSYTEIVTDLIKPVF
ncbi:MAG: D-alanyl-D-alanine carboxypeptidase family protein [Christensenellales bacterium]